VLRRAAALQCGLFEHAEALPVSESSWPLLVEAGTADWRDVGRTFWHPLGARPRPGRSGTPPLGAHTPPATTSSASSADCGRALRPGGGHPAAAVSVAEQRDKAGSILLVKGFHDRLCQVRILDPACGSGKLPHTSLSSTSSAWRGGLLNAPGGLGKHANMLARASPLTRTAAGPGGQPPRRSHHRMVLWIGYLQCTSAPAARSCRRAGRQESTKHRMPRRRFGPATDRAVVDDDAGRQRWDGGPPRPPGDGSRSPTKPHRCLSCANLNPHQAKWPKADFVVGNPPFLGAATMRRAWGTATSRPCARRAGRARLRRLLMFWWQQAADLTRKGKLRTLRAPVGSVQPTGGRDSKARDRAALCDRLCLQHPRLTLARLLW